jgi:hypothetical protein
LVSCCAKATGPRVGGHFPRSVGALPWAALDYVAADVKVPAYAAPRWDLPSAPAGRIGGGGHCGDRLGTGSSVLLQ